jgi:hypothetical protein
VFARHQSRRIGRRTSLAGAVIHRAMAATVFMWQSRVSAHRWKQSVNVSTKRVSEGPPVAPVAQGVVLRAVAQSEARMARGRR